MLVLCVVVFFFFKQKTAYEMRISDWSSDVCSSDLGAAGLSHASRPGRTARHHPLAACAAAGPGQALRDRRFGSSTRRRVETRRSSCHDPWLGQDRKSVV